MTEKRDDKNELSEVAKRDAKTLSFWNERDIFHKSTLQNVGGEEFVFYDGPPFATGEPHYGHILPGTVKDIIPRFQTMNGRRVERKWGWDCHGLPIENLVEKELGLKSKKDIVDFGIDKFNKSAKDSVYRYESVWKDVIPRTGRFVDMENAYSTMSPWYTESVWWAFKELHRKGLVYKNFKVMHICPRCETTISNFEVGQGYKEITDISVYVNFKIENANFAGGKSVNLVAWTTTPWTLPGNAALAVGSDIKYSIFKFVGEDDYFVSSTSSLAGISTLLGKEVESVSEIVGSKMLGSSYTPVFPYYVKENLVNKENGWKVYAGDFVKTEEGTGIVHIAPAFGQDDFALSEKMKIPFIQHVTFDGVFTPTVEDFKGFQAKPKEDHQKTDIEIIKYLAGKAVLFAKKKIKHEYPHCWRCDTPLLNYATSSWFVSVKSFKQKLIAENKKINWLPKTIGENRFGKLLEGAPDWSVSRSRFWGAPLPIWECKECKKQEFVGSFSELRSKIAPVNKFFVMRHGEAENNTLGIVSCDVNNPHHLTELGKTQIKEAVQNVKKLGIDIIISSPYIRTKETTEILQKELNLREDAISYDATIGEVNAGVFNLRSIDEYHKLFISDNDRFSKKPENGESQQDVRRRMASFVSKVNSQFKGKKILIVTHSTPAWQLYVGMSGLSPTQAFDVHEGKKFFIQNAEVKELHGGLLPRNEDFDLDVHRPFIDNVHLACSCGSTMVRVPEVFDTWFDSGSVPYASNHYPFENKETFKPKKSFFSKQKGYPADFISESLDQTRGWFYTSLVLGTALFDSAPYKNVVVTGLVLAEDGRKMSKKLKNYPDVTTILERYGADAMRLYLMGSPLVRGEEVSFSEKGVDEIYKKNIVRLLNVVSFLDIYGNSTPVSASSEVILDKWIMIRLEELCNDITSGLSVYEIDKAVRPIELFVDDISTWYLRRSRDRLKNGGPDAVLAEATLRFVLHKLSIILAPITPFMAEEIYLKTGGTKESVHLESWPTSRLVDESDKNILNQMREVRSVVSSALLLRANANIKVRQPLAKIYFKFMPEWPEDLFMILKQEVNVKEVCLNAQMIDDLLLDVEITSDLKDEGRIRDLVRFVQELRKKAGLKPEERIRVHMRATDNLRSVIESRLADLKSQTNIESVDFVEYILGDDFEIDGESFTLKLEVIPSL